MAMGLDERRDPGDNQHRPADIWRMVGNPSVRPLGGLPLRGSGYRATQHAPGQEEEKKRDRGRSFPTSRRRPILDALP
jgi:hypothetical protein